MVACPMHPCIVLKQLAKEGTEACSARDEKIYTLHCKIVNNCQRAMMSFTHNIEYIRSKIIEEKSKTEKTDGSTTNKN